MHCYWEDKRKHCIKIILIQLTRIKLRKGQTGAKLVQGNASLAVNCCDSASDSCRKGMERDSPVFTKCAITVESSDCLELGFVP